MDENAELEQLMQEPPTGHNHGRGGQNHDGRRRSLATEGMVSERYLTDSVEGWSIASIKGGNQEGGITSHRGVLHSDEYVHAETLERLLEERLGVSLHEFDEAYKTRGRPSAEQSAKNEAVRIKVDALFLEIQETDGNIELLSRLLGINDRRIREAAKRARQRRDV